MKNIIITKETKVQYKQLPSFLFSTEYNLKCTDMMLYAVLFDRYRLSLENDMVDQFDRTYITYSRKELCKVLGCSEPTLRKSMKVLAKAHLIDDIPQKKYMPNKIYLYMPESSILYCNNKDDENEGYDTYSTKSELDFTLDKSAQISEQENTFVKTENCATYSTKSEPDFTSDKSVKISEQENTSVTVDEIKAQINYDELMQNKDINTYLDDVIVVMQTAYNTKKDCLRINNTDVSSQIVFSKLKELTANHIKNICKRISNIRSIKYIKSYILTSLFNANSERQQKYGNGQQSYNIEEFDSFAKNLAPQPHKTTSPSYTYQRDLYDDFAVNLAH